MSMVPTCHSRLGERSGEPDGVSLAGLLRRRWMTASLGHCDAQPAMGTLCDMSTPEPRRFAEQWISNWNIRNLEAVLADYAENVIFTSPTARKVVPQTGGTVHGKDALRRYWTLALFGNQDLHFDLLGVYAGVDTLALHYRNQQGSLVVEVLTFEDGLVTVGHATHLQTDA